MSRTVGRDIDPSPHSEAADRAESRLPDSSLRPGAGLKDPERSATKERGTGEERPRPDRQQQEPARDRSLRLTADERETLIDIGRFRIVSAEDLKQFRYAGDFAPMSKALRSLRGQGLVEQRTVWGRKGEDKLTLFALSRRGKEVAERKIGDSEQRLYSGFVKPAEVRHDAAIYRMYQKEAERIGRAGGRVRRVVLDYELKQRVFAPLAKLKQKRDAVPNEFYQRRQAEVARENGLKVVGGKIPLPDLRIEYERADGDRAHVDLELATHHYRGSQVRSKAEAGFTLYAAQDSHARLSAAMQDPEIVAEIFSF